MIQQFDENVAKHNKNEIINNEQDNYIALSKRRIQTK